jgi:single-stranded-DNA-specific exonuclease
MSAADGRLLSSLGLVIVTTGTLHSKVAGVSASNNSGQSRQNYIRAFCKPGMSLIFRREPSNPYDPNAVAIFIKARALMFFTSEVQIGYLNADLAAEMSRHIDNGGGLIGRITEVTGGAGNKRTLGVNIVVTKT